MHGQLFTSDFLREGIRETAGWNAAETPFIDFRRRVVEVFAAVSAATELNEAQTEDDVMVRDDKCPARQALAPVSVLRCPKD